MEEYYEELVKAIVFQAIEDYISSVKEYYSIKEQVKELRSKNERVISMSLEEYRQYRKKVRNAEDNKLRTDVRTLENSLQNKKIMIEDCIRFFCGDWIVRIADVDGRIILDGINENLKKEGYEV